jgi:type 1 fimbria pilin
MDQAGNNFLKAIRSRNGVRVVLDDSDGQETLILETPGGQRITLQDGPGSIEVRDSNGNTITLEAAGVTVQTGSKVTVQATTVEVNAAMVTVNAAMSKFSGVVQADTVISNSVISASYSPGAGNIW